MLIFFLFGHGPLPHDIHVVCCGGCVTLDLNFVVFVNSMAIHNVEMTFALNELGIDATVVWKDVNRATVLPVSRIQFTWPKTSE